MLLEGGTAVAQQPSMFDDIEIINLDDDRDDVIPFRYSITSYGADYPVDGLVRRMTDGSIFVPSFQRGYVWNLPQASRFVESLLLGLPVPGIFLSKEPETEKLLVIDGQQRLRSLQYFYEGVFEPSGAQFRLSKVTPQFEGVTYASLEDEDRRRLDDGIIHATVVKQDEPTEDESSIYHIFERLNTGGTMLTAQEIRACIYHGEMNAALAELNQVHEWRAIFGRDEPHPRMRDQELLLRFFALHFAHQEYSKPMKGFLNKYMARNRDLDVHSFDELERAFVPTIQTVAKCLGERAFKPRRSLNAAVFDAVMIGIASRLDEGDEDPDPRVVESEYDRLLDDDMFVEATGRQTSDERKVHMRIRLATEAFANA